MATPGRKLPEDDRRRIERLREQGEPISRIAKQVGVSRPTVYKVCRESGLAKFTRDEK